MSAMHHDESSDLRVVGSKLKDILEVLCFAFCIILFTSDISIHFLNEKKRLNVIQHRDQNFLLTLLELFKLV